MDPSDESKFHSEKQDSLVRRASRFWMFVAFLSLAHCGPTDEAGREGPAWPAATRSVPTFGYDALRTGSTHSSLTADHYTPLTVERLPHSEQSQAPMPLYWNGVQDPVEGFESRRLLFFGTYGAFKAVDIETHELVWSLELPWRRSRGTAVLDLTRGKIYFATSLARGEAPAPWANAPFRLRIHSVDLDGSNHRRMELDLDRLLASEPIPSTIPPSSMVHCNTALGLNDRPGAHYVFFGCSMQNGQGGQNYRNLRGARGMVLGVHLDAAGDLIRDAAVSTFFPSRVTDHPETGFDTGVWSSGAAPGLLPDNTLLVATGNGPLIPAEENFGCSVVRIDGTTLRPKPGRSGHAFYSIDDGEFRECHAMNIDMSCSGVASLEHQGQFYSVVTGKDGTLKSFDPTDLPGTDASKKVRFPNEGAGCGLPSIYRTAEGSLRATVVGRRGISSVRRTGDWTVESDARAAFLERAGYRRGACVGWIQRTPEGGGRPFVAHYSGPFRADRVTLTEGSRFTRQIRAGGIRFDAQREAAGAWSTGRTASYLPTDLVGYTFEGAKNPPPGFEFSELRVYASVDGGLYSLPEAIPKAVLFEDSDFRAPHRRQQLFGERFLPHNQGMALVRSQPIGLDWCGEADETNRTRLFAWVRRGKADPPGWLARGFEIAPDRSLAPRWTYIEDNDETVFRNSSPVTTTADDGAGLVIFAVQGAASSYLILLNAETGARVDKIAFPGAPHFTMPLVVGDRIYFATRGEGIYVFRSKSATGG